MTNRMSTWFEKYGWSSGIPVAPLVTIGSIGGVGSAQALSAITRSAFVITAVGAWTAPVHRRDICELAVSDHVGSINRIVEDLDLQLAAVRTVLRGVLDRPARPRRWIVVARGKHLLVDALPVVDHHVAEGARERRFCETCHRPGNIRVTRPGIPRRRNVDCQVESLNGPLELEHPQDAPG